MQTNRIWPLLAVVSLAGCSPTLFATQQDLEDARIALSRNFCSTSADPTCRFVNTPVQLNGDPVRIPGRAAKFFRTANRLTFTDGGNSLWVASRDTLTDGASIPFLFIPIVGAPTDPSVINAAAIHDAHCGVGNENGPDYHDRTWEDTHRMFYDALRVGGTQELKAKIMFAAVYLGGPRWDAPGRDLSGVPGEDMVNLMQKTRSYIRADNPTIPQIERFIRLNEKELLRKFLKEDEEPVSKEEDPVITEPEPNGDPSPGDGVGPDGDITVPLNPTGSPSCSDPNSDDCAI